MTQQGIGASVRRKEDRRFITGAGRYVDDINLPNQVYAVFVRSPHAHAKIVAVRTEAARKSPGVVSVITGSDIKMGGIPCGWQITNKDGSKMVEPPHPALALDTVRHMGDPVAMVLAETKDQAKTGALAVEVEYEALPSVTWVGDAVKDGAPLVWPQAPNNICYDWHVGDPAATDAAFAKAAHVVKLDLTNNRLVANAMEPRAAIGEYDAGNDQLTLYTTSQNPHLTRLLLGAFVLQVPEHKLRVLAPDVGGGFGSKIFHYAEEALVTWASRAVGRPVKWTAERSESFISDAQGRDHVSHAELALTKDGQFLGLRTHTLANLGAYLSTFAPVIPTWLHGTMMAGSYATPAIYVEVKGVFTHTVPVDAYRGAGRPEAAFLVERIVDCAAKELGIDPAEIRRRNFIQPGAFPYASPVGLTYDSGNYEATLDLGLKTADYAGFPARRAESQKRGKLRGIGLSTYVEACGIAPSAVVGSLGARAGLYESGIVRVHPTGSVTLFTGAHSHGQGHETAFAQLAAEYLGIPIDQVDVVHGDTDRIPFGMGTYGSRSLAVGGSALVKAMQKVIDKGKKVAAHLMEAAAGDIEFKDGSFRVVGTDRALKFGEIALAAYVPHNFPHETLEPGLEESAFYDPANFTFPFGCHICEVEIDPETGRIEIVGFSAADDVGVVVNPMLVDGQIHGGVAQGLGQALLEHCQYDRESGQQLTGSYMTYAMPRAADVPHFKIELQATPCPHNPIGAKGCGELGSIGAPPAIINAVVNALSHLGVTHMDMPATPEKVWRAIQSAQRPA